MQKHLQSFGDPKRSNFEFLGIHLVNLGTLTRPEQTFSFTIISQEMKDYWPWIQIWLLEEINHIKLQKKKNQKKKPQYKKGYFQCIAECYWAWRAYLPVSVHWKHYSSHRQRSIQPPQPPLFLNFWEPNSQIHPQTSKIPRKKPKISTNWTFFPPRLHFSATNGTNSHNPARKNIRFFSKRSLKWESKYRTKEKILETVRVGESPNLVPLLGIPLLCWDLETLEIGRTERRDPRARVFWEVFRASTVSEPPF